MKRVCIGALLLLACWLVAQALEINRGQVGYESPVDAMESIRDSTGLDLPLTLDYWAPTEADLANLDIWLHGTHPQTDSTWAKTCADTLIIGRVYR